MHVQSSENPPNKKHWWTPLDILTDEDSRPSSALSVFFFIRPVCYVSNLLLRSGYSLSPVTGFVFPGVAWCLACCTRSLCCMFVLPWAAYCGTYVLGPPMLTHNHKSIVSSTPCPHAAVPMHLLPCAHVHVKLTLYTLICAGMSTTRSPKSSMQS